MNRIILERVENCKFVYEESVPDGHDCWGNTEWYTRYYVNIKVLNKDTSDLKRIKKQQVFPNSGWVIIHDGEDVISVELIKLLPSKIRTLLENDIEKRDRIIDNIIE